MFYYISEQFRYIAS